MPHRVVYNYPIQMRPVVVVQVVSTYLLKLHPGWGKARKVSAVLLGRCMVLACYANVQSSDVTTDADR